MTGVYVISLAVLAFTLGFVTGVAGERSDVKWRARTGVRKLIGGRFYEIREEDGP